MSSNFSATHDQVLPVLSLLTCTEHRILDDACLLVLYNNKGRFHSTRPLTSASSLIEEYPTTTESSSRLARRRRLLLTLCGLLSFSFLFCWSSFVVTVNSGNWELGSPAAKESGILEQRGRAISRTFRHYLIHSSNISGDGIPPVTLDPNTGFDSPMAMQCGRI